KTFSLDHDQKIKIEISIPADPSINTEIISQNIHTTIRDSITGQLFWENYFRDSGGSYYSCDQPNNSFELFLPQGNYILELKKDDLATVCDLNSGTWLTAKVTHKSAAPNESRGAGLRIAKIIDYDNETVLRKKSFTYTDGRLMSEPDFYREFPWRSYSESYSTIEPHYVEVSDIMKALYGVAFQGLSTTVLGNYVGYDKVRECIDGIDVSSCQESTYTNISFICNPESIAPCRIQPYNGQLREKLFLDQNENILKKETYTYYPETDLVKTYGLKFEKNSWGYDAQDYIVHSYPLQSMRVNLQEKVINTYSSELDRWISVKNEYEYYDNGLLKKYTTTNSDQSISKKEYLYTEQFLIEPYITMVKDYNILDWVIEIDMSINNNQVYNQKHNFSQIGLDVFQITSVENSYSGSNEVLFQIEEFDSFNNAIHIIDREGINTSFLFDHLGQNPIVKIINATPSQFFYNGFESGVQYESGNTKAGYGYLNSSTYSISFIPPDTEEYILDYWTFDGSTWKYASQSYTGPTLLTGGPFDEVRIFPKSSE
ncbi:MAG: hypothetical protein AAF901_14475, partial [Bacteroidota bacterium]